MRATTVEVHMKKSSLDALVDTLIVILGPIVAGTLAFALLYWIAGLLL